MVDFKKMLEASKKKGAAKLRSATYITFDEKGDVVVGVYVSKSATRSSLNEGTYNMYIFETPAGLVKFSLGSSADKEFEPILSEGSAYAVEYLGQEKISGGRSVNRYDFYELSGIPDIEEQTKRPSRAKK